MRKSGDGEKPAAARSRAKTDQAPIPGLERGMRHLRKPAGDEGNRDVPALLHREDPKANIKRVSCTGGLMFCLFQRWCSINLDGDVYGFIRVGGNGPASIHIAKSSPKWMQAARDAGPYRDIDAARTALTSAYTNHVAQIALELAHANSNQRT